jgi:heme-degrading monooxygenase HmoA
MWEFRVKDGCEKQFEQIYGPNGDWVQLFKNGKGYLRTELHRDISAANRYITIDYWISKEACEEFRKRWKKEFQALDEQSESLAEEEKPLGSFISMGQS